MTWWAVTVAPGDADPTRVAYHLALATGQAVEERPGGEVVGFLVDPGSFEALAAELRAAFGGSIGVRVEPVEPVDWSERWRDGVTVHQIGRLQVGPSWLLDPGPGRVVVDPEIAFGTGEHGSTRGALRLLDRYLEPGSRMLDVGSGSGILAIAAAQLGARSALGVDIDPDAEPVAAANAERNGVGDRVRFLAGDAGLLLPLLGSVEVVAANILRSANTALLPAIRAALEPDGVGVFAGMEATERDLFLAPLAAAGLRAIDEVVDAGWWSVAARRP